MGKQREGDRTNPPTVRHPDEKSLIAFNAGALDDSRAAEINRHLKNCQSCRRRLVALPASSAPANTAPRPQPQLKRATSASKSLWLAAGGGAGIALLGVFLAWALGAFQAPTVAPAPVAGTSQPAAVSQPLKQPSPPAAVGAGEKSDLKTKGSPLSPARAAEPIASAPAVKEPPQKPLATLTPPATVTPPDTSASRPALSVARIADVKPPIPAGTTSVAGSASPAAKAGPAKDGTAEFFNGKNLSNWLGAPNIWHVEKGAIVGVLPAGQTQSVSLSSQRSYRDFDLRFQASVEEGVGDCGVHFRSQVVDAEHFKVAGPLCAISGKDAPSGQLTGNLLTEPPTNIVRKAPAKLVERFVKPAVNYFHIRCQGSHILIEVNGIKTINGEFPALPQEGVIAWTLNATRPSRKVTFKDVRFVDLAGASGHPPAERPALAIADLLKAEIRYEKAMKAADETLLKHFDAELQKLQHRGHGGDAGLVAAVEHEKEVFKEKGLIPWSRPMRKPLLQYGKEIAAARKSIGNAFDSAIERAEKSQDAKQKEILLDEAARVLAPRPVAIWESTDRGQTHREVFFSDGTYVHDNHPDESISRFWTPPNDDRIVLEYPDPKNPSATLAWVFELSQDGNQLVGLLKNGQKRFLQRVENE